MILSTLCSMILSTLCSMIFGGEWLLLKVMAKGHQSLIVKKTKNFIFAGSYKTSIIVHLIELELPMLTLVLSKPTLIWLIHYELPRRECPSEVLHISKNQKYILFVQFTCGIHFLWELSFDIVDY